MPLLPAALAVMLGVMQLATPVSGQARQGVPGVNPATHTVIAVFAACNVSLTTVIFNLERRTTVGGFTATVIETVTDECTDVTIARSARLQGAWLSVPVGIGRGLVDPAIVAPSQLAALGLLAVRRGGATAGDNPVYRPPAAATADEYTVTFNGFVTGIGPVLLVSLGIIIVPAIVMKIRGGDDRRSRRQLLLGDADHSGTREMHQPLRVAEAPSKATADAHAPPPRHDPAQGLMAAPPPMAALPIRSGNAINTDDL